MISVSKIPIDFVAGSHGHYLETVCNKGFGIVATEDNFLPNGSSHIKSRQYQSSKLFDARHWFQYWSTELTTYPVVVSIRFSRDDLLLLSSISLFRAGDTTIDLNHLENNTFTKLKKYYNNSICKKLISAYPELDETVSSVPRGTLREFFKLSFKNQTENGYMLEQQCMQYSPSQQVIPFDFSSFYNIDQFVKQLKDIESIVDACFVFDDQFYDNHQKFLNLNPFINSKAQCDSIIDAIVEKIDQPIPSLNLLEESYINSVLENIFQKEMPFHQQDYFKSTRDVLYYLDYQAPTL